MDTTGPPRCLSLRDTLHMVGERKRQRSVDACAAVGPKSAKSTTVPGQRCTTQRQPHTRLLRVRPMCVICVSAASNVQAGHHDERKVGQSEEQRRRENALTRVLHMFPSSSAPKRNSTEVTPPNVHPSAERVSRSFSNVWSDQNPTKSLRLDCGSVDACSPHAPLQSLPKRDPVIAGHRASQPYLAVASV